MQERFRVKDQNKNEVLQKVFDNDSKYTTDDEIEEEARRSVSCILFFSGIVKAQCAASITNFNIHLHKPYNRINYKTTKLQLTIQWLPLYFHNYLSLTDNFARWYADDQSVF